MALPTTFIWKHDLLPNAGTYFKITIELSIQGLIRKFPVHRRTLIPGESLSFQEFIAWAIKEAIENQVFRRLTHENYENLYFEDQENAREHLNEFDFRNIGNLNNFPIQMQWSSTRSGVFNIISYPVPVWLSLLNDRNRDLRERNFIIKFQ
ncbi:MAG TPA: hypothetical protein VFP45_03460 [Candidatus Nitrosotalea sp.]|nr:hypothetical protein [Candidatus Nitrosotalea sp.]